MSLTIADLKKGERAIITDCSSIDIPLKLLEMGCLPGNEVHLEQHAPLKDPMYLVIDGCHLAIRTETARNITVELI